MRPLANILRGLINVMLGIVGILLGLRFVLKFFSANSANDFVGWIYSTSADILAPFRGIFPTENIDGVVIEFSTLFALVIYGLLGLLAFYVIDLIDAPARSSTKSRKK